MVKSDGGRALATKKGAARRAGIGLFAAALAGLGVATLGAGAATAHPYGQPHPHPHRAAPPPPAYYAPGPNRGWILAATKRVGDRFDRDDVVLPGGRRFHQMKLCVRRRAVEFIDLDVRFANGGNQDIAIRRVVPAGDCTRNIKLRGKRARNVDRVIMRYTSIKKRGRQPLVEVFLR